MVQKHIIVSMIAPVAIAGILIMAILANQAYASSKSESSSSEKCKTTENGAGYPFREDGYSGRK